MRRSLRISTMLPGRYSRISSFVAIRAGEISKRFNWTYLGGLVAGALIYLLSHDDMDHALAILLALATAWGVALVARLVWQSRILIPEERRILELNRIRALFGIERALSPDSLLRLESLAAEWEQIETSLQSGIWEDYPRYSRRIERSAARTLQSILFWSDEKGVESQESLKQESAKLTNLTGSMEGMAKFFSSYDRPDHLSNGAPLPLTSPAVVALEDSLFAIELG